MTRRLAPLNDERHRAPRYAFTLVEAMVALMIAGMASSALLLSLTSATSTLDDAVRQQTAAGIAQTFLDEITGMRYMELGASPYATGLTAGADEQAATGRSIYDDIDDYNGLRFQPPLDRNGQTLGNENGDLAARDPRFRIPTATINRWRVETDVFYVAENAWLTPLTGSTTSNFRTARVRVYYVPTTGSMVLMNDSARTFSYVPEP